MLLVLDAAPHAGTTLAPAFLQLPAAAPQPLGRRAWGHKQSQQQQ